MLRTIVEKMARGISIKRQLPSRFGKTSLYVSPDSQLKYLKPGEQGLDSELLKIVDKWINENSIVWDIGANVGVFSFAAASIARNGFTLAVEADIWLNQLMRKSLSIHENSELNIQILPCAIADRNGIATFLISNRGRALNALELTGMRYGNIREKNTVATLTLDTLLDFCDAPTFIKIDVEGAELIVLNAAKKNTKRNTSSFLH
jgi:FkbM family methyltransferase